jgi:hypothetical protein
MKRYHVKLSFLEPILGTAPKDKEVYATYIASKDLSREELGEELETVAEVEEKGWTGFHEREGKPFLFNYMIKGFFKDACGALRRCPGMESKKLTAYRKVIDTLVFIRPREIPLMLPDGMEMGILERPLRAQTAQGERIALARSDTCPAGTTIEFDVLVQGAVSPDLLNEWFDYGQWRGLGQWRNADWGSFTYELTEL